MMATTLSPLSQSSAWSRRLVASSTTAMKVSYWSGTWASQRWRLPSRCNSSPNAAAPVAAAGAVLGHEARTLQGLLDEGIGEADAVLTPGELVEVPHIEPLVAVAVEREQALDLDHGGPPR
ncbi:MAG TPA: hypothetical protein VK878_00165 [Candidatus Deferrimicrobiaceae bacterium]|nr:hypothetical protein [Candidatus Deferrimicrobiaceae bacterium]